MEKSYAAIAAELRLAVLDRAEDLVMEALERATDEALFEGDEAEQLRSGIQAGLDAIRASQRTWTEIGKG